MDLKDLVAGVVTLFKQFKEAKSDGVVTKDEKWELIKTLIAVIKDVLDDDTEFKAT